MKFYNGVSCAYELKQVVLSGIKVWKHNITKIVVHAISFNEHAHVCGASIMTQQRLDIYVFPDK